MEYIDVAWTHELSSEPVRLVSELDGERYETRKLEFFANGDVGFASAYLKTENTSLGIVPVPYLDEINADPEFDGVAITCEIFEALWLQYACPARH
ncbi:hypothetical protein P3W85_12785 [Cupriavidus basilensis]|uniref:DUF6881 domain-containing protein n=1 Tax=Cupriavidus basilensis TaxID=68895 RepID=A0ABT6AND1_9BURK|nr:hypothetical protein [Cupriavidus basilensis]MDF3833817.1 hypothetical protein [Cupriavidus basilensis]